MIITARDNKIFKLAKALKDRRRREEYKAFLIEGMRSVKDAAEKGAQIKFIIKKDGFVFNEAFECPVYTFAPKLFDELSDTVTPQGIMAVCAMKTNNLSDLDGDCIVMCESVQDPGNIGTVIRTAHAAFCGGVVLSKGCCDLYNPKTVRATMTGIFSVPVSCNAESEEVIAHFKERGYKIVAGALHKNCVPLYKASLKGKVLIIIGNEGGGVSEKTLSLCDEIVKIPMRDDAESLNVGIAGGILMYEHYRQNFAF